MDEIERDFSTPSDDDDAQALSSDPIHIAEPYYPGKEVPVDKTVPTVYAGFWTELRDKLKAESDPTEKMKALIEHAGPNRLIPDLDTATGDELAAELKPLFDVLRSKHMETSTISARGRLWEIRETFGFKNPPARAFGEMGIIDPEIEDKRRAQMKDYIARIEGDAYLRKHFTPAGGADPRQHLRNLNAGQKQKILSRLNIHLANALHLNPPPVVNYVDQPMTRSAAHGHNSVPDKTRFFQEAFYDGPIGLIGLFAHEGTHAHQKIVEWASDSQHKPNPSPPFNYKRLSSSVGSYLKTGGPIGPMSLPTVKKPELSPHDKYYADISATVVGVARNKYMRVYGKQTEREAYMVGHFASILAAHSNVLNPPGTRREQSFLLKADVDKTGGDTLQTTGKLIDQEVGATLSQIVRRKWFDEEKTPGKEKPLTGKQAFDAVLKFRNLLNNTTDSRNQLKRAWLACRPDLYKRAFNEDDPLNRQSALLVYAIETPVRQGETYMGVLQSYLENKHDFRFPTDANDFFTGLKKSTELYSEPEESLRQLVALYPDDLSRHILCEVACHAIQAKNKQDQVRDRIEDLFKTVEKKRVSPDKKADVTKKAGNAETVREEQKKPSRVKK